MGVQAHEEARLCSFLDVIGGFLTLRQISEVMATWVVALALITGCGSTPYITEPAPVTDSGAPQ